MIFIKPYMLLLPAMLSVIPINTSSQLEGKSSTDGHLLARVITAEAENQSEDVREMVGQVVINRIKHPEFPDTLEAVIYQPNQFQVQNKIWRIKPTKKNIEMAKKLLTKDKTSDIIYFASNGYVPNTRPVKKLGNMYFSK